ncbi:MAG: amino acid adenylation domain-containing protein, partial [Methylococcales bacterium]|nr:amino acid adenylation domain-containing protein [Methylococcales bacterium]
SYGPTECTDIAAYYKITDGVYDKPYPLPIGHANDNVQLFVLDAERKQCVPGVVGELYIAGAGVSQGYLLDAEKTKAQFLTLSIANQEQTTAYKTGDLVVMQEGELVYVGRSDHQIKLRGFRIELGEIESAIKVIPGIKDAIALVKDEQLHAFVTGAGDQVTVKAALKLSLPSYMVPAQLCFLEAFPLTPNGKIDRKALAGESIKSVDVIQTLPSDPMAVSIAEIWQNLLQREVVYLEDDFFLLGGHSLLATKLISRLNTNLNIKVPVSFAFEHTVLSDFVLALPKGGQGQSEANIPVIPRDAALPLSSAQERIWFLHQYTESSTLYNIPVGLKLTGVVDIQALVSAIEYVAEKHEVLRSVIGKVEGQLRQILGRNDKPAIFVHDYSAYDEQRFDVANGKIAEQCLNYHFELSQGPLWLTHIVRGTDSTYLYVCMHHIISDGWSLGVLFSELSDFYNAIVQKVSLPSSPLAIQYVDYAAWQRSGLEAEAVEQQYQYWQKQLNNTPVISLPTDFSRSRDVSVSGKTRLMTLDSNLAKRLNQFSESHKVTPFMLMLSAYMVLLSRYSGQDDICVGTPIAGRHHQLLEPLIGLFVNTLVMRATCAEDDSFIHLLQKIKKISLDAYENQDVPFEQLVDRLSVARDSHHSPLFQVFFSYQNNSDIKFDSAFDQLTVEPVELDVTTAKFEISLIVSQKGSTLECAFEYDDGLFSEQTIHQFSRHYKGVLEQVMNQPTANIQTLNLLTSEDYKQLSSWNATERPVQHSSVITLMQAVIQAAGQSPALEFNGQYLRYDQLEQQSNQLAYYLIAQGIKREDPVVVFLPRSFDLMVVYLGVLKAGGCYVPVDTNTPLERLAYIANDVGTKVVVSHSYLHLEEKIDLDLCLYLDQKLRAISAFPVLSLPPIDGNQLAYIIYTSGSTGQPKGVQIEHHSLINLVEWYQSCYEITSDDQLTSFAGLSFDASVWEIWVGLTSGGCLHLADDNVRHNTELAIQWFNECKITAGFMPTPMLEVALDLPWPDSLSLRVLGVGGDKLHRYVPETLPFELVNLYGPSECAVVSTHSLVTSHGDLGIPDIGQPIRNAKIYILSVHNQLVPAGVVGEICVSGTLVGRGYKNLPQLSESSFIDVDIEGQGVQRLYKTGDLGRFQHNGRIECLGRTDFQVKLRGYRIELGEIQSAILDYSGVKESIVLLNQSKGMPDRLVAYVVGLESPRMVLPDFLKKRLPDYMVPAAFVALDMLPVTANGKIDRSALPEPEAVKLDQVIDLPDTQEEKLLAAIWKDILLVDEVGRGNNFFELGGHSLLVTVLVGRIEATLHLTLSLKTIFDYPVLSALAGHIRKCQQDNQQAVFPDVVSVERTINQPLSYAQQRFWFVEKFAPDTAVYNIPFAFKITSNLTLTVLRQAINDLVRRHEVLRTRIQERNSNTPFQVVSAYDPEEFVVENYAALNDAEFNRKVQDYVAQEVKKPIALTEEKLWRVKLLKHSDDEMVVIFNFHHAIMDGWSVNVLLEDFQIAYHARKAGQAPLFKAKEYDYLDFTVWQRQWLSDEVLQQQLGYWKNHLRNVSNLAMPVDYKAPKDPTFKGGAVTFTLAKETQEKLATFVANVNSTTFMVMLAAYHVLLTRYTKQQDICIGTAVSGRGREKWSSVLGCFVNTLPLRNQSGDNPSFIDFVKRVTQNTLTAFEHQDTPFEKIVDHIGIDRSTTESPLFQTAFSLQSKMMGDIHAELDGQSLEQIEMPVIFAKLNLMLVMVEKDSGLEGIIEYQTDIFSHKTIQDLAANYQAILLSLITAPQQHIHAAHMLDEVQLGHCLQIDFKAYSGIKRLTPVQRDLYIECELDPDTLSSSIGVSFVVNEKLDPSLARDALQWIQDNTEVLRADVIASTEPYLQPAYFAIRHQKTVSLEIETRSEAVSEAQIKALVDDFVYQPYQIIQHSLLKHKLILLEDGRSLFIFAVHHILMDGFSESLYVNYFSRIYNALASNEVPKFDVRNCFEDTQDIRQLYDTEQVYQTWASYGHDCEGFQLGRKKGDTDIRSIQRPLPSALFTDLTAFSQVHRIGIPAILRACYVMLLQHYQRVDHPFVVSDILGERTRKNLRSIGCFYVRLPVVYTAELFTKESVIFDLIKHFYQFKQSVSDTRFISNNLYSQLFDPSDLNFIYNYFNMPSAIDISGQKASIEINAAMPRPGEIHFVPKETPGGLTLHLNYDASVFTEVDFLQRVEQLLATLLTQEAMISEYCFLNAHEAQQVMATFEQSHQPHANTSGSVLAPYLKAATENPEQIAIKQGRDSLSYQALETRTNQLAGELLTQGVKP